MGRSPISSFTKKQKQIKKQMEKQKKQAVRQRKIQYMINKLTGNGQQDSLAQVAKDIVKMKASVFMLKVVQFAGGTCWLPLFSILLVVAIPVVIIFFLLYCSPLGAFMPNPSEENPTVREVLSGYYMDFNTKLQQMGKMGQSSP